MATVTHYIYSNYDPAQREAFERATGQVPEASPEPEVDPWQTESAFGAQRRFILAPRFVPAIVSYDEINDMMTEPPLTPASRAEVNPNDVSRWYRSLTRGASAPATVGEASTSTSSPFTPAEAIAIPAPVSAAPVPFTHSLAPSTSQNRSRDRRNKKDWFIARALRSEPATTRSTPTPTIADILSREPPPFPAEKRFAPPVFLALGPANKGFAMLQKSGWSEGEPLGPGVARRAKAKELQMSSKAKGKKREEGRVVVQEEQREVPFGDDGEVSEVRMVDVIDLTLSDSENEEDQAVEESEPEREPQEEDASEVVATSSSAFSSHNPTALITPLPTVLKSDRLGVGLKAKTVGPYKQSKKRITHGAAALAAHIRANEEMRRMKKFIGRGTRGFTRIAKAESESRKRLLASLKD